MLTSTLIFTVLILFFLLLREKNNQQQNLMMVDGHQLAHDIRSPLLVLKSLIRDQQMNDHASKDLMNKLIDRIEQMTVYQNNFEFFKKDEFKKNDIKETLEEVIAEKKIEYQNLKIQFLVNTSSIDAFTKKYQLKRILSNLINNSVEAAKINPHITISIGENEFNHIELNISDNGVGIESKNLEKIFNKVFSTKRKSLGLGLYHAKKEIESWGGKIEVESKVGVGTTFKIKLLKSLPELVLLEDEELIREGWRHLANKSKLTLKTFKSSKELYASHLIFKRETKFYLDEELGEKIKGQAIAKKLYRRGLREIYLCSGHDKNYFKKTRYVKSIVSKEFPVLTS